MADISKIKLSPEDEALDIKDQSARDALVPFVGSGSSHKAGLVPDPGATAGTSKYLREDGTWSTPGVDASSNAALGQGYGTCSTAGGTVDKLATLANYQLVAGGIVSIKFSHPVPANATLSINSQAAKDIYFNNAPITAGVITTGDTVTFIYSTRYHVIAIDRGEATTSKSGLMSATDKSKLDGIETGANKTTVDSALSDSSTNPVQNNTITGALAGKASTDTFSTSANGLVPKSSASGATGKYLKGDGTWDTPENTTYSTFNTTTNGLVPMASTSGATGKFLKGDGTWALPSNATQQAAGLMSASDKKKLDGAPYFVDAGTIT